jgi:uncharacterized protein
VAEISPSSFSGENFRCNPKWIASLLLVGIELLLALTIGLGFVAMGAGGGAWILGGIAAGALVFYFYCRYNHQAVPNRNLRKLGQMLVGLTVGLSIQNTDVSTLSAQLPIFGLLTAFLLFSGGAIGYLYSHLEKTDLLTAVLATVPGNIGVMASIAADYGREISLVSLVQLIRFTTVILVVPIAANVSNSRDVYTIVDSIASSLSTLNPPYLFILALSGGITFSAVQLGSKFKVPVAAFICSLLVGIFLNSLLDSLPFLPHSNFSLPPLLNLVGQALLGITIGEYWGSNSKLKKLTIARAFIPVILTFGAGFISASLAMLLTPWDWLTCLLVTSPGGSPEMILIALALHHNVEIVTAGHLVRLMTINLSLPVIVTFVRYLESRLSPDSNAATSRSTGIEAVVLDTSQS